MTTTTITPTKPSKTNRTKATAARRPSPEPGNRGCWQRWADDGTPTVTPARVGLTFAPDALATIEQYRGELDERLATGQDPARVIDSFLAAGDSIVEHRDRYATLRTLEKLAATNTRPVDRPDWGTDHGERRRTLTPTEAGLVRLCALDSPRSATVIGNCEAGAASGELHLILPDDIDLDTNGHATAVRTRGTVRTTASGYPTSTPRELVLPEWCRRRVGEVVAVTPPGQPLLYQGSAPDPADRQSAVLMQVGKVLTDAGLKADPTVTPLSIRNTAARAVYHQAGVEAAARLLGIDDFNFVLCEIGVRPHPPTRKR